MKKIAGFISVLLLALAELAWASAVVTSSTGTVSAQAGTGTPRAVRVGDRLNQGDTVVTGPLSAVVMKFDDGQVTALSANSRMTVTAYNYDRTTQRGNYLLSLVTGGMRSITGLIGKNSPRSASIRAASATIGIRGTELSVTTLAGVTVVEVAQGVIEFTTADGKSVTVNSGQAALLEANGTVSADTINNIYQKLNATDAGKAILSALGQLAGLTNLMNQAAPGIPPSGDGAPGDSGATSSSSPGQTGTAGSTGSGGGSASPSSRP